MFGFARSCCEHTFRGAQTSQHLLLGLLSTFPENIIKIPPELLEILLKADMTVTLTHANWWR